jgi:hypothetical protein
MNWTSPTKAVSTVVGSCHSTRTFRCTHWALKGKTISRIALPRRATLEGRWPPL